MPASINVSTTPAVCTARIPPPSKSRATSGAVGAKAVTTPRVGRIASAAVIRYRHRVSAVADFIVSINDVYWYAVIALLVVAGLYFSVTTLIVQIRMFPEMIRAIFEKPSDIEENKKGISAF